LTSVDLVDIVIHIDERQCVVGLTLSQEEPEMSRVQLALNVADLEASIEFYTQLFQTPPAKIRDGYANFAIADPPLKLVLFTGMGEPGSLNHVGVEVESTDDVMAVIARTRANGMDQDVQENTSCCYAVQDKTWIKGPENDWEFYTVLGDAPSMACGVEAAATGWSSDDSVGSESSATACCP
jgi:catechol 2,3-dioxygenase-like lactoylglutathione lyase family enzyme